MSINEQIVPDMFCATAKLFQRLKTTRFKRATNLCPQHKREGGLTNSKLKVFYL